ncbi:16S rRNA (guanine(966)-N(2))-methyltransferase RsmD [Alkalilimnicola sp. S0819]|uniref:16S rRNA (guanine(966)-N(2))-methyltransferase RsmD n=1 Tax=Alkalilimnicola sp. S0819 TaxID=2613922 RepID=UPI00126176E5|nr:16S rRNA (guanine(966)-N(2))-methyltransferase RsmD [Alkalilimnicola sp. S0819]KAB7627361.1 16S rRNA (guanine(966)-N(2))-methyltransferase RsmD [Alkalilimnicola sp. S0819]MPQ16079.1 16S rRNA (guanine(966)-N(2))-methyltransferase RsmD [Alkalilimnicola sp. S0819]
MSGGKQSLRIIGGHWRGRKLDFPATVGLRPTGDRIRETLFNWLQPLLPAARCLDLFAGSGALGLEALSRGASEAVLVERDRRAATLLRENIARLGADRAQLVQADALGFLRGPARPFHLVFLDPPFDSDIIAPCCQRLEEGGWLSADARIYLEQPAKRPLPPLPASWHLLREKRAGEVAYYLAAREHSEQETT